MKEKHVIKIHQAAPHTALKLPSEMLWRPLWDGRDCTNFSTQGFIDYRPNTSPENEREDSQTMNGFNTTQRLKLTEE